MKVKSLPTTVEHLKTFFSQAQGDQITLDQAFSAWGRNLNDLERNKQWLANKLTSLRHYGFIESVKESNSPTRPPKLIGLKITDQGKEALGKPISHLESKPKEVETVWEKPIEQLSPVMRKEVEPINEKSLLQAVADFKKSHPEYRVTFHLELAD